ncbi:MAG: MBL fold metallo-hydrolase [Alphaproteobacteria bacterium]|nr:MBL fold metallo-hydrolase [Alphaproteobacteria bacterium]
MLRRIGSNIRLDFAGFACASRLFASHADVSHLAQLGTIDIVNVPVDGVWTLNQQDMIELLQQINRRPSPDALFRACHIGQVFDAAGRPVTGTECSEPHSRSLAVGAPRTFWSCGRVIGSPGRVCGTLRGAASLSVKRADAGVGPYKPGLSQ